MPTKQTNPGRAGKPSTTLRVYHYPNCSTCRKALGWLAARGLTVDAIDLVAHPPSAATLRELHRRSGLPLGRLFNTSGESYRSGGWKDRLPGLSAEQAYAALAADGKLIKRPVVDTGEAVLVGFDEAAYATAFHLS